MCSALAIFAWVSLSLSTTNGYNFAMPPSATNMIKGVGAGYDEPYNIVRYEDVTFLVASLYERWSWTTRNYPHYAYARGGAYHRPVILSEIANDVLDYGAEHYFPWSCGVTNYGCLVKSEPWFRTGAFECDDTVSWKVNGVDYTTTVPIHTLRQSCLVNTNDFRTNRYIRTTTPVSLAAITNNYHNLALMNHVCVGPRQEVFFAVCSNCHETTTASAQYGERTYGWGRYSDQYLTGISVTNYTTNVTHGASIARSGQDNFTYTVLKERCYTTYAGTKANDANYETSTVLPVATVLDYTQEAMDGWPASSDGKWEVLSPLQSHDAIDTNASAAVAYFVGLFEVRDITTRYIQNSYDITLSSLVGTETNSIKRYVYVFAATATGEPTLATQYYMWKIPFDISRFNYMEYFLTESGVGSSVDMPQDYQYPSDRIPATVEGQYVSLEFNGIARRTKTISLEDIYVIWYLTPLFKARVTTEGFNLN